MAELKGGKRKYMNVGKTWKIKTIWQSESKNILRHLRTDGMEVVDRVERKETKGDLSSLCAKCNIYTTGLS